MSKNPFDCCPELKTSSTFSMRAAMEIVTERAKTQMLEKYGVSLIQAQLLLVARERLASQIYIAEAMNLNKNSMTQLMDRSVKLGIVRRVENPDNRKEKLVEITPKGRHAIDSIMRDQKQLIEEAFFPLSYREVRKIWGQSIEIIETKHRASKK